jgi:general secretion pathway protein H
VRQRRYLFFSGLRRDAGFSLLELLVVIGIAGLLLAVSAPASMKFYQSIEYRQAVREVTTILHSARFAAVKAGAAQDVGIYPAQNRIVFGDERTDLPAGLKLAVHTAREVNRPGAGVIRFYPEGGSTGGDIDIERPGGDRVRISVDWLVGRVTQHRHVPE